MFNRYAISHNSNNKGIIICMVMMLMLEGLFNTLSASVPMRLSESDSGKTVELSVGNELEVVLPGKPTTGYVWVVSSLDTALLSHVHTDFIADTNAIGAGGMEIFRFKAVAVGKSEIKLIFHRPFEQKVPPIKTFSFTVIIREQ